MKNETTTKSLEEQIREAAYYEWLDRGCPVGDEWSHWFAAEARVNAANGSATQPATAPHSAVPSAFLAARPDNRLLATPAVPPADQRAEVRRTSVPQRQRTRMPETSGRTARRAAR